GGKSGMSDFGKGYEKIHSFWKINRRLGEMLRCCRSRGGAERFYVAEKACSSRPAMLLEAGSVCPPSSRKQRHSPRLRASAGTSKEGICILTPAEPEREGALRST